MKMDRRKFLLNTSTAVAVSTFYGAVEERRASAALSPAELEGIHCARNSICCRPRTG